jgi:AraC-like DNA-binding protein
LLAVEAAGLRLYATDGAARIGALAAMLGLFVRQLERRFKEGTGLPPKAFARLVRFSRVSERLEHHPDESLTELAFEFGYADQAHFNREFRTFAGVSPGRFADEARRAAPSVGGAAK